MKASSAKAKGRRLMAEVREKILETFPELEPGDIEVTPSGVPGEDLWMSPKAKKHFPFAVEGKNQERLQIWQALEQASSMRRKGEPLLVFKRNRSKTYCALELEYLLRLTKTYLESIQNKNMNTDKGENMIA